MSNVPGISPITPDLKEVRHSDEDGFFGKGGDDAAPEEGVDEEARQTVEEGRRRVFNPRRVRPRR